MNYLPNSFYGEVVLSGTNGDTKKLTYFLGKVVLGTFEYAQAVNAFNQIRGALADVTDAFIQSTKIIATFEVDYTLPETPPAMLTTVAVVNVLTTKVGGEEGFGKLNIPAPSGDLFVGTTGDMADVLDTTNANLLQYVQQVAQHAFISDGEQINTSEGYGGINPKNPGGKVTQQKTLYKS